MAYIGAVAELSTQNRFVDDSLAWRTRCHRREKLLQIEDRDREANVLTLLDNRNIDSWEYDM